MLADIMHGSFLSLKLTDLVSYLKLAIACSYQTEKTICKYFSVYKGKINQVAILDDRLEDEWGSQRHLVDGLYIK